MINNKTSLLDKFLAKVKTIDPFPMLYSRTTTGAVQTWRVEVDGDKYRFITGHAKKSPDLKPYKQTQLLLVILESLHKDEAELLCKMFKKDLGVKYLTPRLIKEAYPEINLPLE
jgi:hypothetical protein